LKVGKGKDRARPAQTKNFPIRTCVSPASVEAILEKIARARQRLEQIEPGSTLPKRRSSTPIIRRAQP
jgi:hypothetical protein